MKAHARRRTKDAALLTSLAESIGSALGTIAAKANAAQKVLARSSAAHVVEREGKRLARGSKAAVRKTRKAAAASLKTSKVAKASRRGLHRAASPIQRAARRR
ncbi:MAG TPA: hypothetical protein VIX91_23125 [Candidatus Acidoferrum sp.]